MTQTKQVKQQGWHLKNSIQSLFKMHVTMGLSSANDWGGRGHDSTIAPSPTLRQTHTHIHTPLPLKTTAAFFPPLWMPLATAVEMFSRNKEGGKAKQNGEKMRGKIEGCMETNIYRALTLFQIKTSEGKSGVVGAEISQWWQEVNRDAPWPAATHGF